LGRSGWKIAPRCVRESGEARKSAWSLRAGSVRGNLPPRRAGSGRACFPLSSEVRHGGAWEVSSLGRAKSVGRTTIAVAAARARRQQAVLGR
jgi:hypothetical protein